MENKRPCYEDIEPPCKWRKEKQNDVLEVHLEGFKKDQLKVQITNPGALIIRGECSLDKNRMARFLKVIGVSKDCKTDQIHARFSRGVLYITVPKKCTWLKWALAAAVGAAAIGAYVAYKYREAFHVEE